MASEHVITTTESTFDAQVINSDVPVLVDFWATWCGPCKALSPLLDKLADENGGKIKVAKLDVDSNRAIALKYNVNSLPTLLVFKGGEVVSTKVGAGGGLGGLRTLIQAHI